MRNARIAGVAGRVVATAMRSGARGGLATMQSTRAPAAPLSAATVRWYSSGLTTVEVPGLGDSVVSGEIGSILVAVGDAVDVDQPVLSIETSKVDLEVLAPTAGVIKAIHVSEGDEVEVGAPLVEIDPSGAPAAKAEAPKAEAPKAEAPKAEAPKAEAASGAGAFSPPSAPPPLGEKKAAAPAPQSADKADAKSATTAATTAFARTTTRTKMKQMRQRIAERLKESQNTYAQLTTFQEVDMHALMNLRNVHKDAFFEKHGVKLGFMSAFAKASANALLEQPAVNAVIDGSDIVYRDFVDISVAVATPKGLVVPVVRNVESMGLAGIEKEIAELGSRARSNKLALEDMEGGTFTISNGGVFGSMLGTPIINPPQSAILGLHNIVKRPVVVGPKDEIVVRPVMYLALTYDHRLIDGREAVSFLRRVKMDIEDPMRMLLDL